MRIGNYKFRLLVTDESNNLSTAFEHNLTVVDEGRPVAIITGPQRIPFGKGFTLSGEKSSDEGGGKVVKYTWTLIETP